MKRDECSDQEQWVLERLEQGEETDLVLEYGVDFRARRLRATFLEALLTDEIEGFKPKRQGIWIAHALIDEALDLENAEVEHIINLYNCVFEEEVNFRDARFKRHLSLNSSRFEKAMDCHRLRVEINFFCRGTTFQGPVDFGGADFARQFIAGGAKFENKKEKADFNGLKVGQHAFLNDIVFQGPVDFTAADIGGHFSAEEAQFKNTEQKANFNSMKVGRDAFFDNAVFQGPVDFGGADISGHFSALGAKFDSPDQKANFNLVKVGDVAFFDGAVFKGGLALNGARLLDLMLRHLQEPLSELSLERTMVGRELAIENATITKLLASNLEVKVNATLKQVAVQEKVDLRDSSFQVLHLHNVDWPKNQDDVRLEGLSYKAITAGDEPRAWESILDWVENSRFNSQNYSELEAYFARCGHRDRADQVFIAGKRRATNRLTWWKNWFTKILWGGLTGLWPQALASAVRHFAPGGTRGGAVSPRIYGQI